MSFVVISVTENLPRYVARRVSEGRGKVLSDLIVVFPTVRLGQHFRKELGVSLGACLPPRVMTLNSLIEYLSPSSGGRPVTPIERLLILRSLLREGGSRHLGPGMEDLISGFLRELADAGYRVGEEETFQKLLEAFRSNQFGSESYEAYWLEFSEELRGLTSRYGEKLEELGLVEPAWQLADPERVDFPPPREKILICGFYDATTVQLNFLKKLSSSAEFIYQAEKSQAFEPAIRFASALGHQIKPLLPREVPPVLLAVDSPRIAELAPESREKFSVYSLPSLTAEAKQAKYESLKAEASGRSVMVVVPRKAEYVNVFSAVFSTPISEDGVRLPSDNALARKCFEDPAVQLLCSLFNLAASGFNSYALSNYLQTPGGGRLIEEDGWKAARLVHRLKYFLAGEFSETYPQLLGALKEWPGYGREKGEELLEFLERLHGVLSPFLAGGEEDFAHRAEKALELFSRCRLLFPPGDLEAAVRSQVELAFRGLIETARALDFVGSPGDFLALVKRNLFSGDVYTTPEPFRGVQLLHILEARSVPADVVILCGMNEGEFPAAPPLRLVEELSVRQELGLLTSERREELEELNFFSLAIPAERVVLTRCAQALKEEAAESRFITRLKLAGCGYSPPVPVGSVGDNLVRLYRLGEWPARLKEITKRWERARPRGFFPGKLPEKVKLNTYRSEMFLNCPARFFFDLWGVEAGPEAREEPDALYEGTTLHKIAAALWELHGEEVSEWDARRLEAALRELGEERIPPLAVLTHLRLMMRCGGWRRTARWFEKMLDRWKPGQWEKKVKREFSHKGRLFLLSGQADFIGEREGGEKIVVDFKRKNIPSRSEIEELNRPQLPFYSLCLEAEKIKLSHLGYCSFLKKDGGYLEEEEGGLGGEFLAALKERADRVVAEGGFNCAPSPKYCLYCSYQGICRVEDVE